MRIDKSRAATHGAPAGGARRKPGASGQFRLGEAAGDGLAAEAEPPATALAATACLAALAQAGTAGKEAAGEAADRAAASHGEALLSGLAGLQAASLGGGEAAARQALAALASALPQASSPGLQGILQAIAQRAGIELARQG